MLLHITIPTIMSRAATMDVLSTRLQGLANRNLIFPTDESTLLRLSWKRAMMNILDTVQSLRWRQTKEEIHEELESKKCLVVADRLVFTADVVQVIQQDVLAWIAKHYGIKQRSFVREDKPITIFKIDEMFLKFGPHDDDYTSRTTQKGAPLTGRVIMCKHHLYFELEEGRWSEFEDWTDSYSNRGTDDQDRDWVEMPGYMIVKYVFGIKE